MVEEEATVSDYFRAIIEQYDLWQAAFQANGKEINRVRESKSYKWAKNCIGNMIKLMQKSEIHYGYLQELTKKRDKKEIVDILTEDFKVTKAEIFRCWNQTEEIFKMILKNLLCSISVLNALQSQISSTILPSSVNCIIKDLCVLRKTVETGQMTSMQLEQKVTAHLDMSKLSKSCDFLQEYVNSKIFWTSCKDKIEGIFKTERDKLKLKKDTETDTIESIRFLYDESRDDQNDFDSNISETFLLLQVLTTDGIKEYKRAWASLIQENENDVRFVMHLLKGANVEDEIVYAENILREPIPGDVKNALRQLEHIDQYMYTVDAIKQSLPVFGINTDNSDDVMKAISNFDRIREKENKACPFSLVVTSLKLVDRISKEYLKETIDILQALGEASSLVQFLKQIVDEDIRNLIDAVEDISEQHVQESTVSALIEVKSFLQGTLVKSSKGFSAREFLTSIDKQTKMLSHSASKLFPAKIVECMSSLHNLKSLYGNVANRGEITAETISNILLKGTLKFMLNKEGICDFFAIYRHGSRTEKQVKHALFDLRSRALLLMNTRAKTQNRKISSESLEKFVSCMDLSIEIAELCNELHQSGNMEFLTYNTKTDCQGLSCLNKQLQKQAHEWNKSLQSLRNEFYLLNFVHGPEIHLLYSFFEHNTGMKHVLTILRYIHPDIQLKPLVGEYKRLKALESDWSNKQLLRCFGSVLHFGYEGRQAVQRPFQLEKPSKRVTDVVQNKKLFIAALDENSNQVVNTLLALYHNTTQTLPEPHQVLMCTRDTTWNELELLLSRCFGAYQFTEVKQLFCIANIEMLTNELQFRLVEELKNISTENNYLLSMICRGTSKHPFLDELNNFINRSLTPLADATVRQAFQNECPEVITYTSEISGLGKTNAIKVSAFVAKKALTKIHISGSLCKKTIIEGLSAAETDKNNALHIDIGSVHNPVELDIFIFELIILRYVTAGCKATSLATKTVFIEIANTVNDSLRNSLNTVMSFKREHLLWRNYSDYIVSMDINSSIQVVCHYLKCLEERTLDTKDLSFNGNNCEASLEPLVCRRLLRKYFGGKSYMSFSIVNTFLHVLADQLKKMACSAYFRVSRVEEMIGRKTTPSVRSTLLQALVEAAKEFASRSITSCRSTQRATVGTSDDNTDDQRIQDSPALNLAEQNAKGMIRWEDSNHLIFVFHNQNIQTLSPLYRDVHLVPGHIKSLFESQMKRTLQNFKQMDQPSLQNMLEKIARTNLQPLSADTIKHLNAEYALTPDNLLKMILIMLRIKAHIPVIVMGETGCGKTSLIRYLATVSDVDFDVLSIHAGIQEKQIIHTICKKNEAALLSPTQEKWLFLDEINTSEHIGVMNDAICSGTCLGKVLAPNLIIMGACNPYRLRTEYAISTAGLKGKIKTDDLSKLVYRVLPLPERMVDYVWDFGSLSDKDEAAYIRRMVEDVFWGDKDMLDLLQDLLSESQTFVRNAENVSYCVSLRDVQRCKTLIKWFLKILPDKDADNSMVNEKSVILALCICYLSRFSLNKQRETYRKVLARTFTKHGWLWLNERHIHKIIVEEQKDILNRMVLPTGTAKNTALQENVFVILVCLLNKIPIFLVGKPGCSKSLSVQVIRSNLRGKDSKNPFFKLLPQLYCVSFQGSESSTSDGIIKVFEKAIRYQKSNNDEEVLSVVILDEIGLAEISAFNPLKVLHNLLEPDGRPQPDVAVVGISNWSLDASKMNRGIHLSRPDMDEDELFQTGVSISESFLETKRQNNLLFSSVGPNMSVDTLSGVLRDIAKSYIKYTEALRFKHFHGLRDFYSLVKFVSKRLMEDDWINLHLESEKQAIVLEGLQRNFGGLPLESATLLKMFQIQNQDENRETTNVLKLVRDNINDKLARHLMCITRGESVLSLLENVLMDIHREERVVIFGSHFEEDQTADYNYRILSRIILCMEQGFVLILRDLEHVYGSLYDMLNQNYTVIGKKKHCRVALGHYSNPICQVHDEFKCIVLVDERKVDFSDPPFLNRFEKQYLEFTDSINSEERGLIFKLQIWTDQFCSTDHCHFDASDCFPIYSQDMIPSLIIKTFRDVSVQEAVESDKILEIAKLHLLYIAQPDAVFRLAKSTGESIRESAEQIKEEFLNLPIHSGIWHFIDRQIARKRNSGKGLMTVVFTNSSIHNRLSQKKEKYEVQVEKLGAFKSEKQLSMRVQHFWSESLAEILFFHCSVVEDERHIPLAKTTIENVRLDALKENPDLTKHIYLILHLERRRVETKAVTPINFLSGWELITLDTLEEPDVPLSKLWKMSLYESVVSKRPLARYITDQLFWSFTRIKYPNQGRNIESIFKIIEKIKCSKRMLNYLEERICEWIESESITLYGFNWQEEIALDAKILNENSSFVLALEHKLSSVINIPLSKLLYQLENMNALASYFCDDRYTNQRQLVWERLVYDLSSFSIKDIPAESGPECYLCTASDLTLNMPISRLIFDKIEETRDEFMESYFFVKGNLELDDENCLPCEVMEALFAQHESALKDIIPEISIYMYDNLCDDYFHDFSNFVSSASNSRIREEMRVEIVKWTLAQKMQLQTDNPMELFVKLHATFWIYSSTLSAEHQLFETCAEVFNDEENFRDFIVAVRSGKDRSGSEISSTVDSETHTTLDMCKRFQDVISSSNPVDKSQFCLTECNLEETSSDVAKGDKSLKTGVKGLASFTKETLRDKITNCSSEDTGLVPMGQVAATKSSDGKQHDSLKSESDSFVSSKEELYKYNINIQSEIPNTAVTKGNESIKSKYCKQGEIQSDFFNDDDASDNSEKELDVESAIKSFSGEESHTDGISVLTNSHKIDADEQLIKYISLKMLPNEMCWVLFKGYEDWNTRVSMILTLAVQISSEPQAFHALRFCQDVVNGLQLCVGNEKHHTVMKLGRILLLNEAQNLDSSECFDCVYEILFKEPKPTNDKMLYIIASYLNRCLAASADSQVMIYLLQLLEDQKILTNEIIIFKPSLYLALNLEINDTHENIYHNILNIANINLEEYPFLCALNATLRKFQGSAKEDSQFCVLIVDILESFFYDIICEKTSHDFEDEKAYLMSAHKILVSNAYDLKFLTAVSYYKAIAKFFADILRSECTGSSDLMALFPTFQAILSRNEACPVSYSLNQYLIKEYGKGMLPWKFYKTCESMTESLEVFKTIQWTETYNASCIEGNPIAIMAPSIFQDIINTLSEKDAALQEQLLLEKLKCSDDSSYMLALHGAVQSTFYIPRSYRQQDDSINQLAKAFEGIAIKARMDPANLCLIACLLGVQVFSESIFELDKESDEEKTTIALVCTSLFATVLSSNQKQSGSELSFLAKCLMHPVESKADLLIAKTKLRNQETNIPLSVESFCFCSCGYRFLLKTSNTSTQFSCPVCRRDEKKDNAITAQNLPKENNTPTLLGHTSLHAVTSTLISLYVHACLLGSLALKLSDTKDMECILEISEVDDIPDVILNQVKACFRDLKTLLDMCNRDTFIFLQACLLNLKEFICEDKTSFGSPEQLHLWSQEFEKQIEVLLFDRHGTILNKVKEHSRIMSIAKAPELGVNENDEFTLDSERLHLPSIFRVQGKPSKQSLEHEVDIIAKAHEDHNPYPFLAYVLKVLPQLEKIKYLLPLIQWHLATVTHTGYQMKRYECLEMTVHDFIRRDDNRQARKLLEKRFKKLQEAWTFLMKAEHSLQITVKRLTYTTRLKECLILNNDSTMYKIIRELVNIQNTFLDTCLQISATHDCQALKCLSRTCGTAAVPCTIVADVKSSSIISYEWDDRLLQFSQADLRYGYGQRMQYEFDAIEKSLALDLVVNKCYLLLDTNLPSVVFIDEFYKGYARMVKEINIIIPQKPLPSDMAKKIKDKGMEGSGKTVELITHVGILMALAKKTKGIPEQSVTEYVDIWKNVLTRELPLDLLPAPEDSVKLCHLVGLYGLLEELSAEPISNLTDRYREPLTSDVEAQLNDLLNSNKWKAKAILQATKRFTYRCLYGGEIDCSRPLIEYIDDDSFWPVCYTGHLEPQNTEKVNAVEFIPTDLKVENVYGMMTFIEDKLAVSLFIY